jgi:hypothetical protein
MITRRNNGVRTDRLKNCQNNCYEDVVIDTEYYSPDQHGKLYGTVYRQYFSTKVDTDTITITGISKLLNAALHINTDGVVGGYGYESASNFARVFMITDAVEFDIVGWTVQGGWIEYTK